MNKNTPQQYISNFDVNKLEKNISINNNLKKNLVQKLNKGLSDKNISNTLNAAIELHCSGYFSSVLKKLIEYYFNEINIEQIQFIHYIVDFMNYYSKYSSVKKTAVNNIVNDQVIRNFICFFSTLLINSTQRKLIKLPKIKQKDFDLNTQKQNIISKDLNTVSKFITELDPKEIIIPLSEICNYFINTNYSDREHKIIYWISWLFEYEKIYHKNALIVSERVVSGIDKKHHKDFIWIVWTIIKYYSNESNKIFIYRLFDLFIINYTKASRKSKSNILITAVMIIVNPLSTIKYPVKKLSIEQYKAASLHELRCNEYYLKLFQNTIINQCNQINN